jgi:hypothetical protein
MNKTVVIITDFHLANHEEFYIIGKWVSSESLKVITIHALSGLCGYKLLIHNYGARAELMRWQFDYEFIATFTVGN